MAVTWSAILLCCGMLWGLASSLDSPVIIEFNNTIDDKMNTIIEKLDEQEFCLSAMNTLMEDNARLKARLEQLEMGNKYCDICDELQKCPSTGMEEKYGNSLNVDQMQSPLMNLYRFIGSVPRKTTGTRGHNRTEDSSDSSTAKGRSHRKDNSRKKANRKIQGHKKTKDSAANIRSQLRMLYRLIQRCENSKKAGATKAAKKYRCGQTLHNPADILSQLKMLYRLIQRCANRKKAGATKAEKKYRCGLTPLIADAVLAFMEDGLLKFNKLFSAAGETKLPEIEGALMEWIQLLRQVMEEGEADKMDEGSRVSNG